MHALNQGKQSMGGRDMQQTTNCCIMTVCVRKGLRKRCANCGWREHSFDRVFDRFQWWWFDIRVPSALENDMIWCKSIDNHCFLRLSKHTLGEYLTNFCWHLPTWMASLHSTPNTTIRSACLFVQSQLAKWARAHISNGELRCNDRQTCVCGLSKHALGACATRSNDMFHLAPINLEGITSHPNTRTQ